MWNTKRRNTRGKENVLPLFTCIAFNEKWMIVYILRLYPPLKLQKNWKGKLVLENVSTRYTTTDQGKKSCDLREPRNQGYNFSLSLSLKRFDILAAKLCESCAWVERFKFDPLNHCVFNTSQALGQFFGIYAFINKLESALKKRIHMLLLNYVQTWLKATTPNMQQIRFSLNLLPVCHTLPSERCEVKIKITLMRPEHSLVKMQPVSHLMCV